MLQRLALIPVVAFLASWIGWQITRPDRDNWLLWLMASPADADIKLFWGFVMFGISAAVLASLVLFLMKNGWAFTGMLILSLIFAWLIAMGAKEAGEMFHPVYFANVTMGMLVSFPLLFSDLVRGRQADARDTKEAG